MNEDIDFFKKIEDDNTKNINYLHLTPNENIMSNSARNCCRLEISDRYYFGKSNLKGYVDLYGFTALGYSSIDQLFARAEEILKKRFNAKAVNLYCLSGIHAMLCTLIAATNPGDIVMSLGVNNGGHYATKNILKRIGRRQVDACFDTKTMNLDVKATARKISKNKINTIYLDPAYVINEIDVRSLKKSIKKNVRIIFDASHLLGLIMGGVYSNPITEGADIICANTHKTFPGPQKGIILFGNQKIGDKVNKIMSGGLYSSVHTGSLLALAVSVLEMDKYCEEYANKIIKNANYLASLIDSPKHQVRKVSHGVFTKTHQIHLITSGVDSYDKLYERFNKSFIAVSFDKGSIFNGGEFMRIGVQEITRRGMGKKEMKIIAKIINEILDGRIIKNEAYNLKKKFNNVKYSFDIDKEA